VLFVVVLTKMSPSTQKKELVKTQLISDSLRNSWVQDFLLMMISLWNLYGNVLEIKFLSRHRFSSTASAALRIQIHRFDRSR